MLIYEGLKFILYINAYEECLMMLRVSSNLEVSMNIDWAKKVLLLGIIIINR